MPKISIIMPVFNVEDYVSDAIHSVLNQNFTDYELIIINDGSTDQSMNVIKKICDHNNRIKIFEQKNLGQSAARNLGLKVARGKYIYFLDADDLMSPNAIDISIGYAERMNLDLVTFSGIVFSSIPEPGISERHLLRLLKPEITTPQSGEKLLVKLYENDAYSPSPCLYIARADLIKKNRLTFDEGFIHEDIEFTTKLYIVAQRAISLQAYFFRRRVREGSTTSSNTLIHIKGYIQAIKRLRESNFLKMLKNKGTKQTIRQLQIELLRSSSDTAERNNLHSELKSIVKKEIGFNACIHIDPISIFYLYLSNYFYLARRLKRKYLDFS